MKAYVAFVQAYSKHEASYIFRLQDLDLIGVAKSFGLLRLPAMPELKKRSRDGWDDADIDVSLVSDFFFLNRFNKIPSGTPTLTRTKLEKHKGLLRLRILANWKHKGKRKKRRSIAGKIRKSRMRPGATKQNERLNGKREKRRRHGRKSGKRPTKLLHSRTRRKRGKRRTATLMIGMSLPARSVWRRRSRRGKLARRISTRNSLGLVLSRAGHATQCTESNTSLSCCTRLLSTDIYKTEISTPPE